MSRRVDKEEAAHLQYETEHVDPGRSQSVMPYLVILVAAAFLLLLMAYFMQQRANQDAINNLQNTSSSAVESIQNLIDDNSKLQQEVQELEAQLAELQQAKDDAVAQSRTWAEKSQALADQVYALNCLNTLRTLYNSDRPEARRYLADLGEEEAARVEALLGEVVQETADQDPAAPYDPQRAWTQLVGWLS